MEEKDIIAQKNLYEKWLPWLPGYLSPLPFTLNKYYNNNPPMNKLTEAIVAICNVAIVSIAAFLFYKTGSLWSLVILLFTQSYKNA